MANTTLIHPQVITEIKAILPSSYPIKRLTYLEMQELRDQGLCLNCNNIDTSNHRCLVKRIVLVLPDEVPNTEQQPLKMHAPTVTKQPSSQDISLHAINHVSDPEAMRLSTLFYDHRVTSIIVEKNGKSEENNGSGSKNYKSFLADLIQYGTSLMVHIITCFGVAMMTKSWLELLMNRVECTIKTTERKVLVFDPGGVSPGQINYADKLHDAMFNKHEHNLLGLMLENTGKKPFEKVVFIFYPGGVLRMYKAIVAARTIESKNPFNSGRNKVDSLTVESGLAGALKRDREEWDESESSIKGKTEFKEKDAKNVTSVKLGTKEFCSGEDMFNYFYNFLCYWSLYIAINGYEHMILQDLIRRGHADHEKIIGPRIKSFHVRYHPMWKSRCFFFIRVDGIIDDFSLCKCVDMVLPLPDNMKIHADNCNHSTSASLQIIMEVEEEVLGMLAEEEQVDSKKINGITVLVLWQGSCMVMCNSIIYASQLQRRHRQLTTLRTRSVSRAR